MPTKFYHFRQNNSGGSFDIDDKVGLGPHVWIEANDTSHAIERALALGIYFNGCDSGIDCPCCGDRWSEPWDDGSEMFKINPEYNFNWWGIVYVHFLNGQIERIHKSTLGQKAIA